MMKLHNVGGTTPMLDGTRMVDLLTRLKNLPWANGDDHEARVGEILDEYGIDYTYQPNGTQNFPDYEIPTRWGTINLECKSSQNAKPMYNSDQPNCLVLPEHHLKKLNTFCSHVGLSLCVK